MRILGNEIKNARHLMRISQEDLAERVGVTRQAIASWEDGKTVPDLYTAAKLAKALNVSLEELVSMENGVGPSSLGPKEKRFLGTVTIGKDGKVKLPKAFLHEMGIFPGDQMLMLADVERGIEFLPMDILWKETLEKHWEKYPIKY